jgi:SOUL heme-binding protein
VALVVPRGVVWAAVGLGIAAVALGAVVARAAPVEEPAYDVVSRRDGWEIRRYAPVVQAQITVTGPFRSAINEGFRALAGYIFGGNAPGASIAMTAPVSAQAGGQHIAMTAPVAAASEGPDAWTVAFTMPSSWALSDLPAPNDPRVRLVEVDGGDFAALRFGGWATAGRVAAKQATLLAAVADAGMPVGGAPVVAQYDPPWSPVRRNEILVPLR